MSLILTIDEGILSDSISSIFSFVKAPFRSAGDTAQDQVSHSEIFGPYDDIETPTTGRSHLMQKLIHEKLEHASEPILVSGETFYNDRELWELLLIRRFLQAAWAQVRTLDEQASHGALDQQSAPQLHVRELASLMLMIDAHIREGHIPQLHFNTFHAAWIEQSVRSKLQRRSTPKILFIAPKRERKTFNAADLFNGRSYKRSGQTGASQKTAAPRRELAISVLSAGAGTGAKPDIIRLRIPRVIEDKASQLDRSNTVDDFDTSMNFIFDEIESMLALGPEVTDGAVLLSGQGNAEGMLLPVIDVGLTDELKRHVEDHSLQGTHQIKRIARQITTLRESAKPTCNTTSSPDTEVMIEQLLDKLEARSGDNNGRL